MTLDGCGRGWGLKKNKEYKKKERVKRHPEKELEVIYEYIPTEDARERLLKVYEMLLFDFNKEPKSLKNDQ